jgi:hypothetical protein
VSLVVPELSEDQLRRLPSSAEALVYQSCRRSLGPHTLIIFSLPWIRVSPHGTPREGETDFIVFDETRGRDAVLPSRRVSSVETNFQLPTTRSRTLNAVSPNTGDLVMSSSTRGDQKTRKQNIMGQKSTNDTGIYFGGSFGLSVFGDLS